MKKSKAPAKLVAYKYTGTGNSFLIFDARAKSFDSALKSHFGKMPRNEIVKLLCNASFGIGADGVIFAEMPEPKDFKKLAPEMAATNIHLKWDFYNSDGSTSEMCGNGARCMGAFAKDLGFKKSPLRFISGAGLIEVTNPDDDTYTVKMPEITTFAQNIKLGRLTYDFIDTGVPHVVIDAPKNTEFAPMQGTNSHQRLEKIVQQIRAQKRFSLIGTNVTFVWPGRRDTHLYAVTFERGVTGYTQACGTGAVAAAYSGHFLNLHHTIAVTMPGGHLDVTLSDIRPTLTGLVDFIAAINF